MGAQNFNFSQNFPIYGHELGNVFAFFDHKFQT